MNRYTMDALTELEKMDADLARLRAVATAAVRFSGRGYDCLPDGWIAVPAAPYDALRDELTILPTPAK